MLLVAPREQTGNTPPTLLRIPYLERIVMGRNRFSMQTNWLEVRHYLHIPHCHSGQRTVNRVGRASRVDPVHDDNGKHPANEIAALWI
jgi:hypothetical protein